MVRKNKKDKIVPTLNIWIVLKKFKVATKKHYMFLNKNELLFLLNIDGDVLKFRTEKLEDVFLSSNVLKEDKIKKVYP